MALSDILAGFKFGSSNNQPTQQQQPAPPIQAAPASSVTNPNPIVTPDNKPLPQAEAKPMQEWDTFWEPPKPVQGSGEAPPSVFSVTQKQIMEAAGKADFTKALSPDLITKILSGGEEAPVALTEALNKIAQHAYGQSSFAATKITQKALEEAEAKLAERIPQLIRDHTVKDSLRSENPIFSNPAVTPMLEMIQGQMAMKFPNATAAEITQKSKEYLKDFATVFSPQQKTTSAKSTEVDWSSFLES